MRLGGPGRASTRIQEAGFSGDSGPEAAGRGAGAIVEGVTPDEAIALTRAHIERQFPKVCTRCERRYESLAEYLLHTSHAGDPQSYDAELDRLEPTAPIGTFSLANCGCGGTMSIGSDGMSHLTYWRLMAWAWSETRRRGITFRELLAWVRSEIDRRVLSEVRIASRGAVEE